MLIDERIAAGVDDHLDAVPERLSLFKPLDAVVDPVHPPTAQNGVGPEEDRNLRLDRIGSDRQVGRLPIRAVFFHAGRRAGQTDLSGQNRQHGNGARRLFAVGLALRPEPLSDEKRLGRTDFLCQVHDGLDRYARNAGSTLGGFGYTVGRTHDVGLVVGLGGSGLGQRLFVVAHAVFVQENLIHPIVADELVGNGFNERRIGARTNRDPLIDLADRRVRITRIDDDGSRLALFKRATELIALGAARATRHRRIVAEGHVKLGVGDLLDAGSRFLAVGKGESRRDLSRRVRAVVAQVASHQIHEALPGAAGIHKRLLTAAVVPVDGLVAVLGLDFLPALGNRLVGLVPADAFELGVSALTHTFHRVLQSVGRIQTLTHRASLEAGADLTRTASVLNRVVGFDANDFARLRIDAKRTAVATVDHAGSPGVIAPVVERIGHGLRESRRHKARGRQCRQAV